MKVCFDYKDFEIFDIEDLEGRMKAIRENIQPVFQYFGDTLLESINDYTGYAGSFHIAKHRRRTVNPPGSTWSAFGGNKRGYKKYPHIQIGINEKYIFMFLAIIDNPRHEKTMARYLLDNPSLWSGLSEEYHVSRDHTKIALIKADDYSISTTLQHVNAVKKGEFMIGRIMTPDSEHLQTCESQESFFKETLVTLLPAYKALLELYHKEENR
ncbi:DUF1054 family protein [Alkalibacterium kapii]|uniref:UPF0637 protein n=1 Tax=Alkalibacterium kapii TaxID=426704 RepID=A0A511ATM9_9LACT|nr:DUF1054 family protein [Alkalibacterium kapii]GEK91545.1 UPF0637 protein [Alkalibacterium kapii]